MNDVKPEESWVASVNMHIRNVGRVLSMFCEQLMDKAVFHDASKKQSPEAEVFAEYTPKLKTVKFLSDEYKQNLVNMGPALDHHYANNRHHPEHFPDGVAGMTLSDLIEMFADWYVASMRNRDGDPARSVAMNAERFGLDPMLTQILLNTIPGMADTVYVQKLEYEDA